MDTILGSRYKIIQHLSKGGFGTTYLAEDTQYPDNLQCVVKKLHSNIDDAEVLEISRRLFDKEAKTLAKLGKHNQIPQLLAFFEEEREFYLVQEYVQGKTLTNELIIGQPWSAEKVMDFLSDFLKVIDFVHSNGVIHRDIKPDNLIRRHTDQKIVLVDFGAVKDVIKAQTAIALTVGIGTQGYMPTEQARGRPRLASDIYAVGMIAVQALTGIHPVELPEDENGEIIWQDRTNCTPQLKEILYKMVRYHFKDRYQSAQEILTNLSICRNNLTSKIDSDVTGIMNPIVTNSGQAANVATASTKANPLKPIGLAMAGLLLVGGVVLGGKYLIPGSNSQLQEAQAKAQAGEYTEAIAIAQDLPTTPDIQAKIDRWAEQLLDRAEAKYTRNGEIETASVIIEMIPETSPARATGQELLTGWRQEHEYNQSIVTIAKEELQKEKWQNAKQEAAKITSKTPYWQKEAQNITKAADLGANSQPGVVDLCSKAPDLCN